MNGLGNHLVEAYAFKCPIYSLAQGLCHFVTIVSTASPFLSRSLHKVGSEHDLEVRLRVPRNRSFLLVSS